MSLSLMAFSPLKEDSVHTQSDRVVRYHVPWVDPHKPLPPWLTKRRHTKNELRTQKYYIQLWLATPLWETRANIATIYSEAHVLRLRGHDVQVDHITPINAIDSCGLHCLSNLQILTRQENQAKSNRYYPGMPYETIDMFNQPEQFELLGEY